MFGSYMQRLQQQYPYPPVKLKQNASLKYGHECNVTWFFSDNFCNLDQNLGDDCFGLQKKIVDTPIAKHPNATQGLNRSPDEATQERFNFGHLIQQGALISNSVFFRKIICAHLFFHGISLTHHLYV
jgi:hypothetical protein